MLFKDERNLRKLCSEMEENLEATHKYRAENSVCTHGRNADYILKKKKNIIIISAVVRLLYSN